jgi:hypothetical protein
MTTSNVNALQAGEAGQEAYPTYLAVQPPSISIVWRLAGAEALSGSG